MAEPRYYAGLLRAINVGGRNKLPMKDLVKLFEEAGATHVKTYVASGNVVFKATPELAERLPELIHDRILADTGMKVPIVLRTAEELAALPAKNPYKAEAEADYKRVQVVFCAQQPTAAQVAKLDPDRSPPITYVVDGPDMFMHTPDGVADSKYTVVYLDRVLGTTTTGRNWRTVEKLIELTGG